MKTSTKPTKAAARHAVQAEPIATVNGMEFMAPRMAAASQAYIDAIGKCQSEICEFVMRRLSSDLQHGQTLAQCKDWSQAAQLQQAWLRQTVEDYVSEGQKLIQLGASTPRI